MVVKMIINYGLDIKDQEKELVNKICNNVIYKQDSLKIKYIFIYKLL